MPSSFCGSSIQESRHCLPKWCCSWFGMVAGNGITSEMASQLKMWTHDQNFYGHQNGGSCCEGQKFEIPAKKGLPMHEVWSFFSPSTEVKKVNGRNNNRWYHTNFCFLCLLYNLSPFLSGKFHLQVWRQVVVGWFYVCVFDAQWEQTIFPTNRFKGKNFQPFPSQEKRPGVRTAGRKVDRLRYFLL